MNDDLHLSQDGINLVHEFEGCLKPIGGGRFRAYLDPVGIPTIGWGHTNHHGRSFKMGDVWTQNECDMEFSSDMIKFEADVKNLVQVDLEQYQFDALVSFAYNCGGGALGKSTLLRRVNASDFEGAANEFAKWNKAGGRVLPGLTRRRAAEAALFRGIGASVDAKGEPMAQKVDEPAVDPISQSPIANGALVAGGLSLTSIISMVFDQLYKIPGRLFDQIGLLMQKPYFWGALAVVGAAGYIYYKRRKLKQNRGV